MTEKDRKSCIYCNKRPRLLKHHMIICPSKPEETPKDVISKENRRGVLGHDDVDFFDQEYFFAKEKSKPSGTDLPLERDPELDEDLNFVIRDSSDHDGDPMDHVSQEDEYLSYKEDISEDGKNDHKEISNGIKEACHYDEDFCPDNELKNGSSQGEEESQYESKYIAEIATLKAGCEGDISAQGTDLQDLEKEIFKDTPNIKSTEKTMALLQEVNMNKLSSNGMKSDSKSKTKGEIDPPQKSVTEPLGRSHQPTGCSIVCDICSKVFQYKSQLAHHATVHSEERPFSCSICSHSFKSKRELKYHMKSCHEPKKLICQYCSKGFHSSSWLKRHEQCVHTGDKPYPCDMCNKKFGAITDLRDHKKRNHEEKVLKCQQCEKSFSCNRLLKSHIKHKHGDKLFNCEYCGYSCVSKQSLNEHLNTHTGNRPHKCKTCEKGFTTHSALRIHNLIHTGVKPYSCSICKQAFRHKQAVEAHEKKHTKVGDQREVA